MAKLKPQSATIILFLLLFAIINAVAQTNTGPLKIGDQITDDLWSQPLRVVNHPDGIDTITLEHYKGRLIILDFWATWCTSCIRNFPKLRTLKEQFDDQIQILAVTKEDIGKISNFFSEGIGREYTFLNSVVHDHVLSAHFPHKTVPHVVWIDPNGKVLYITQAEELTQSNIQAVLDSQLPTMLGKVDIDRNRPLFLSDYFGDGMELQSYSIFSKGYYPGLPVGNKIKRTKDGKIYGRQMTNATMMNIFNGILSALFDDLGEKFNSKRTIIEVKEPALLQPGNKGEEGDEYHNLFNFELIVPEDRADSLFYYMLADLNRYSDYIGTIERREVDCLVLIKTSAKDKIKSKGGQTKNTFPYTPSILSNLPISYMVNRLSDTLITKLPIMDETGYTDNVDIELSGVTDLESLRRELNRYDLDLMPAKRKLNMFVIRDKN